MSGQIGYKVYRALTSDERIEALRTTVELYRDIEFAAALGVSKKTIYRLTDKGLPTLKIGGVRFVNPTAAMAWLNANAQPGPGRPRKVARDRDDRAAAI